MGQRIQLKGENDNSNQEKDKSNYRGVLPDYGRDGSAGINL